jgi:uncharacterized membrane protein
MKNIKYFSIAFVLLIILKIFNSWFFPGLITAGDFWPYSKAVYETKPLFMHAWDLNNFGGLGGNVTSLLWVYFNFGLSITLFGKILGLSWILIERIYYLFPFLIFTLISSYKLSKKIFQNNLFAILSSTIYLLNTYSLMVVGGGQIPGIGMSYSILPFIFYLFICTFDEISNKKMLKSLFYSLLTGLILSIQIILDLRIAYITIFGIVILWLIKNIGKNNFKYSLKSLIFVFIVPGTISLLINSFWILPTAIGGRNPIQDLGSAYSSIDAVKFFSFAKLEDTLSLLHPNWPENIFGKTGFLKPEFLILPLLSFSSLFFINKLEKNKRIYLLSLTIIGLVSIFLAKGANDPFGAIYILLFNKLPGFIMFRDPTKWYVLISLFYSISIPFAIMNIYQTIHNKFNKVFSKIFLFSVIIYLLYLINPALLNQLSGTFKSTTIPSDYVKFEKFLSSQVDFSRALWIPTIQRFGYYSNNHPAVPAQNYFNTVSNDLIFQKLNLQNTKTLLQESSIKYIVIPNDNRGEIFITDTKYDEKIYANIYKNLLKIEWLKQKGDFGKIKVFEIQDSKDHFWTDSKSLILSYKYISPVEYRLNVKNAKEGDRIIFAENYNASWIARDIEVKFYDWENLVSSNPYKRVLNSFTLRKSGDYNLIVYYYPQITVILGQIIGLVSFLTILFLLSFLKFKKKI